MRILRLCCCLVVLSLCGLSAENVLGASLSGKAGTVLEWFDDAQEDTANPVYQYLQLNVRDIDDGGLLFRGYGRLADDLANEVDTDSRLYYAYLEKKGIFDKLDFRLGRQFISTTAGASIMDGLQLKYRGAGPFDLEIFGGGDVAYYEGYNAEDLIAGAEVSGHFLKGLDLGLSYLQKWEDSQLSHELIGFDFDYRQDDLFSVYSETQYSWLTAEVTYFLVGAKYFESSVWSVRAEYLYSLPVFSSTSIYSVFAVNEYEEIMAEADFKISEGLRAFGRYTREFYEEWDDQNVFEAGLEKLRTERFSGYLSGLVRDAGGSQDMIGLKAHAAYLFTSSVEAGVGAHLDVVERRLEDQDDESTNTRLWADLTVFINKKVNVQAKVERVDSDLWDYYNRGRIRLNILF